jgi:hypothetical protein
MGGRVKVDLLFCYKLLYGLVDMMSDDFIVLSHYNHLQRNQYKLVKPIISSARDAHFLCNRIINILNCLPDAIVTAGIISGFKHRLSSVDFSAYVKFL